jgi:hypothetical protein
MLMISSTTPQIPALTTFLDGYRALPWKRGAGEIPRVKVAVIDNGVIALDVVHSGVLDLKSTLNASHTHLIDNHEIGLSRRLKRGNHISFVHGHGSESPWWHAEDPHGTQMANLIAAIDPQCDLYIARVCTGKIDDIRIQQVVKVCLRNSSSFLTRPENSLLVQAIKWATEQKVDIISMSFALYEVPDQHTNMDELMNEFRKAVTDANTENILMICSTADDGKNQDVAYPAHFKGLTMGIAGCNTFGSLLKNATSTDAEFLVPGRNVHAGVVPFLTGEPRISGSSVATAIAAGLASLTLSCHLYAGTADFNMLEWKKAAVRSRFNQMTPKNTDDDSKYIRLSRFCGDESMESDRFDVKAAITRSFTRVQVRS